MNNTRVLVADDHQVVRQGVCAILASQPGWVISAEVSTGREAVATANRIKPDLVIMDISMPDMNGVDATRLILKDNPGTEVLILSMHESEQLVRDVLASGARGYVLKSDAGTDLLAAAEALRNHRPFFTSKVASFLLRGYLNGPEKSEPESLAYGHLTPREREVLQLVAEGNANKEVAHALNLSVKTVVTLRARILEKLNLHSVSDMVRYAIKNNIIQC
jgi:DNA-binding NarL/FixJ family response regulator